MNPSTLTSSGVVRSDVRTLGLCVLAVSCLALLAAAWLHLSPIHWLGVTVPMGTFARLIYLAAFASIAARLWLDVRHAVPVRDALPPSSAWLRPCAVPLLASVVVVTTGVFPPENLFVEQGGEFQLIYRVPAKALWYVWSPSTILDFSRFLPPQMDGAPAELSLGFCIYRPVKILLFWVVRHFDLMPVALTLQMGLTGALVAFLLLQWGASRWTAVAMGLLPVVHPLAIRSNLAIDFHYGWAALLFLGTLASFQALATRPTWLRAVSLYLCYSASVLISETWLAGVAPIALLWWTERSKLVSDDTGRWPSFRRAMAIFAVLAAALFAVQVYVNLKYPLHFGLLQTSWELVFRNVFFEPHWAFLVPFVASLHTTTVRTVATVAAALMIVFPSVAMFRLGKIDRRAMILWVTAGIILGPSLAFFDMAEFWSTTRFSLGPNAFLTIALGLMTENIYGVKRARFMTAGYVVGAILVLAAAGPAARAH